MPLKVIGAGFGRTGTLSLKSALETLGLGPCYHMTEVWSKPDHPGLWQDAVSGRPVDWEALFAGYGSAVDWPACAFWEPLRERWPEALVLLSRRDSERWYQSVHDTIYTSLQRPLPPTVPPHIRTAAAMANELVFERTFGGRFLDRAHAVGVYERHNERVIREVPPERLLVFEVSEGWAPLCARLELPVPAEDFPRVNSTDEFRERMGLGALPGH
ncbi:MAG: sulfotransferase family protein [Myxococcota bacterium]